MDFLVGMVEFHNIIGALSVSRCLTKTKHSNIKALLTCHCLTLIISLMEQAIMVITHHASMVNTPELVSVNT